VTSSTVRNIVISAFIGYYLSAPFFSFISGKNISTIPYWFIVALSTFLAIHVYSHYVESGRLGIKQCFAKSYPYKITSGLLICLFLVSLLQLYFCPWHLCREGMFSSLSALIRLTWLSLAPLVINTQIRQVNNFYMVLSIVLSVVDGSRTIFFVSFMVSMTNYFRTRLKAALMLMLILVVLLIIASVRSGWSLFDFANGFIGEQTLATLTFYNIIDVKFTMPQVAEQLFYLLTLPFLYPIYKVASYFVPIQEGLLFTDVTSIYSYYQEMGGAFLLTNFTPFGIAAVLVLPLYLIITIYVTNLLISWYSPIVASYITILSVKSDPFVYWNLIYLFAIYLMIFSLIIRIKTTRCLFRRFNN